MVRRANNPRPARTPAPAADLPAPDETVNLRSATSGEGSSRSLVDLNERQKQKQLETDHRAFTQRLDVAARQQQIPATSRPFAFGQQDEEFSSEDEEEDIGNLPDEDEARILETLMRIKQKDPLIYKSDVRFFEEPPAEAGGTGGGEQDAATTEEGPRKRKPLFLKDVIARQALEHGAEELSDEDDDGVFDDDGRRRVRGEDMETRKPRVYDEEQAELRGAFLSAIEGADDGEQDDFGGVLKKRDGLSSHEVVDGADEEEEEEAPAKKKAKKGKRSQPVAGAEVDKLLDAYFGDEEALDDGDRFLKRFIQQRAWVDKDEEGYIPRYDEVVGEEDVEKEEEHLQHADHFEASYNFRFEEPGATVVVGHPRHIADTVRKGDERRKLKRAQKAARQAAEGFKMQEEVKQLKNMKKAEISSRLAKVQASAGVAAPDVSRVEDILDGEFDPDEWDRKMAAAFDDEYYGAEDMDLEGVAEEADVDVDDESAEEGDGQVPSKRHKGENGHTTQQISSSKHSTQERVEEEDGEEEEEEETDRDTLQAGEEGEYNDAEGAEGGQEEHDGSGVKWQLLKKQINKVDGAEESSMTPEQRAHERAELQRMLQEYYALDYEDNIGGIKTRYRYKPVPASSFGLSIEEILSLSDKELNQVVGLKRLAPYREDASKQRPNYKALQQLRAEKGALHKPKHVRQYESREWKDRRPKHTHVADSANHGKPNGKGQKLNGQAAPHKVHQSTAATAKSAGGGSADDATASASTVHAKKLKAVKASAPETATEKVQSFKRSDVMPQAAVDHQHAQQQGKELPAGKEQHEEQRGGKKRKVEADPQAARLASYAKLTMKKNDSKEGGGLRDSGSGGSGNANRIGDKAARAKAARVAEAQAQQGQAAATGLTKAQRKNLLRAQKRAKLRAAEAKGGKE